MNNHSLPALFFGFAVSGNRVPTFFPIAGVALLFIGVLMLRERPDFVIVERVLLADLVLVNIWSAFSLYFITDYCFMGACA